VLDLARFVEIMIARGVTPEGKRVLSSATLDSMWTPQFAAPGATNGFGIGFNIGRLDGHRTIGHGGAIYGFATEVLALPDDSLGVVVTATLDGVNAVTDHIAQAAVEMLLNAHQGKLVATIDTTTALAPGRALTLMGRYANANTAIDLDEYEGRLFATPVRGGSRAELRAPANGSAQELIVDDRLSYGRRIGILPDGRIVVGRDTLRREPTPRADVVPIAEPEPPAANPEFASLIGEYGWDHDVLYIREKDGQLNALIEWFFEYPLERASRDVYRFPKSGLYDGQEIVFHRGADGKATSATVATVLFKRRPLPADNDRVNFRITPVRPPSELRKEALAASPPKESSTLKKPDLVELRGLDSTIKYDIRYATSNNFMGTPFYTSSHAFMQRPAAEAVARASAELRKLGYGLLIHDAYRPWYVTKMFWDGTPPDKHVFVADPSQGSRHNRGCAVDLTLYDLKTGAPIRMTGGYDEMTDRSYPLYPGGATPQRWHRDLLRHAMEAQGFNVYEAEWWHFDYKDWRSYPIGNLTFEQLAR
jgi:D-alanyl-D-alanine dipeptidase